jgi:predicted RND superfamily exporter protein
MPEAIFRGLARLIDAHPRRIALACLLATALATGLVVRIPVSADLLDVMPENTPSIVAFTDFLRDFGVLNGLVVVVESQEPSVDALVTAVQTLGEQLSVSPYVTSVDYNLLQSGSRFVAEHFPLYLNDDGVARLAVRLSPEGIRAQMQRNRDALLSPLASPLEGDLISRDPLNIRELVQASLLARLPATRLDLSTGYYLDRSHRLALLTVRPGGSVRDTAFVRGLYREVSRIAAQAVASTGSSPGFRVGLAGGYARAAEALGVIWQDMVVSFSVSFVLVMVVLYLAFRPSLLVMAIFVVTLFASLAWTLLLAYLLYGTLNIITSIVAAMLIGLFVDYIIQTFRRFRELFRQDGNARQAMEQTLAGTGKAILSGALTTSVAFFSVVVTSFRGLHELGVVAGFGILFCLAATLFLLTSLLAWLAQSRPGSLLAERPADLGEAWMARLVERHGRVLVAGFALLVVASIVAATRIGFDASLESVGLRNSAVQVVEERVAHVLGRRGEPLFVVARAADDDGLGRDFDALEGQGARWRRAGVVGSVASLGMLLPPPFVQRDVTSRLAAAGLAERIDGPSLATALRVEMDRQGLVPEASLDAYAAGIARAVARREEVGPREYAQANDPRAAYYYNPTARALAAHLTPPGPRWDQATLARLSDDVGALGPDFQLVGPSIFLGEIRQAIVWEAGLAIVLSFAGNLLILRIHFITWRRVWLVMLPVTVGTVLTVGTMGILRLPFNFFNVAGIALIFGFGVDYGIYLMQAHVEGTSNASPGPEAVRTVGASILLCAATTLAGCGSLITSHYRGLASIGAVLCFGALFCLLVTLFLLPIFLGPRTVKGAS